jgi:uncharacterized protein YdaU (DUF1376 family)
MPFYVADYLADTTHLSAAEHGAYMLLILHYWQKGALPDDEAILARVCRMTAREWVKSRDVLASFFGPGWTHERINFELEKARVKSEARAEFGSRGGKAKALNNNNAELAKANGLPAENVAKALASSSQPTSSLREESSLRSDSARFEEFYAAYPKRINRKAARARFVSAEKSVGPAKIIAGARRYAEFCQRERTEPQFIKAPDVWLNKGCWDDEYPLTARAGPAKPSDPQEIKNPYLRAAQKLDQEYAEQERRRAGFTPSESRFAEPESGSFSGGGGPILDLAAYR